MAHHFRIAPDIQPKRAWTSPAIEQLSVADALIKLMKAKRVPVPMIEQIRRLSRTAPDAE